MSGCAQAEHTGANSEAQSEAVGESGTKADDTADKKADENANQQNDSDNAETTSADNTSKSDSPAPTAETTLPINDVKTSNVAMANLGINVIRELDIADENVMISPFSLSAALSLTANGAEGETKAELENALGFPIQKLNEAFADYEALTQAMELPVRDSNGAEVGTEEQKVFFNANSLWLGPKMEPKQSFLDLAAADYNAEVQVVDGATDSVVINEWVNAHTNGMIPMLVDEDYQVDPLGLNIINAVVFDCAWKEPYTAFQVYPEIFTTSTGEEQEAQLLYSQELGYIETPFATGFIKDYTDSRFAFAALLPTEGTTPDDLLDEMAGEDLFAALKDVDREQKVSVALPEFESTFEVTLNDALQALGVKSAFDPDKANFSGVAEGPLWIDEVLQKTYVSVDRHGTKAAAVSIVEEKATAAVEDPIPEVRLDRPFVYVIFETESTTPLFIGVVNSLE